MQTYNAAKSLLDDGFLRWLKLSFGLQAFHSLQVWLNLLLLLTSTQHHLLYH